MNPISSVDLDNVNISRKDSNNKDYAPSYLAKKGSADSVSFSGKKSFKERAKEKAIRTGIWATIVANLLTMSACAPTNKTNDVPVGPQPPAVVEEFVPSAEEAPVQLVLADDTTLQYEEGNIASASVDLTHTYNHSVYGPGTTVSTTGYNDFSSFVQGEYGDLEEGQRIAVARAIVDQNRELITNINQYYLLTQAFDYLDANLQNEDEAAQMSMYVEKIATGEETFAQLKEDDALKGLSQSSISLLEDIQNKVDTKGYKGGFEQYSEGIDTKYINPEMIFGADYSDVKEVFAPVISTMDQNDKTPAIEASSTYGFVSMLDELEIDLSDCETNDEKVAKVTQAIVDNYGIETINSYAGAGILSAIGLDNRNNAIFDKTNESLSDFIQMIVDSEENGKVKFATPDTNLSVLTRSDNPEKYVKDTLMKEKKDALDTVKVTYLHTTQTLVSADDLEQNEDGSISAKALLAYVQYGEGTLLDALNEAYESGDKAKISSVESLGRSALEQLFSNNPLLFGDWTDGLSNEKVLNYNIAHVLENAPDGKLMLEDVKYVVEGEEKRVPAPVKPADPEPTTTAPGPDPTTSTPDPTTSTPDPTTSTPDPTTSTPDPTTSTPDPTTKNPDPTTKNPDPTTKNPDPTTKNPDPTTTTPNPTTKNPDPTTQTPTVEPDNPNPDPPVEDDPTTSAPNPTTSTPAPDPTTNVNCDPEDDLEPDLGVRTSLGATASPAPVQQPEPQPEPQPEVTSSPAPEPEPSPAPAPVNDCEPEDDLQIDVGGSDYSDLF